ncbi:sigma-70 family RNA polymerase sigma factor [Clostridium estertheticum]|uniref:sigma-70 family RNA polymerase sigma factor n=1 Tax=Clostridium estertheticum TaxID=238834 RepID=UPI001C0AA953|nr:sigma-70 family RNA polymerase sigma factor [Clostridium estertheticum]MBU3176059.1 sigma-70 family RNA polymerase sigma factor [Clostridium estertheticum]
MKEELIQLFKDGNKQAGDDFYNANKNLVKYAVKLYKLDSMDQEETFALVNQAFAKTMEHFEPGKGKFTSYFMISARGYILRHFRDYESTIRASRQDFMAKKVIHCDSLERVIFESEGTDVTLQNKFGEEDDHSEVFIQETLKGLEKLDRDIFILYHLKDFSQSEIGKILGIGQVRVSRSLARSMAILRISLKEVS